MSNKNITIILPVHTVEGDYKEMLKKALESVEDFHNDVKVKIVCPTNVKNKLKDFEFGQKLEVEVVSNTSKETDFCSQVNLGISACDTEWFSILEMDDEYKSIWLKSTNEYAKKYEDVHIIHLDAHTDLREDYMGEELSHASVIRRCYDIVGSGKIFQFGIRSGMKEEFLFGREHCSLKSDFEGMITVIVAKLRN